MRRILSRSLGILVLSAFPWMGACGGGGGDGGSSVPGAPAPTPGCSQSFSLSGVWTVDEDAVSPDPDCTDSFSYSLTFTQSGSSVAATDTNGRTYNGTYCHPTVQTGVPFSYPEDGGTTTVTALTITVLSANSMTFSSSWTWVGPGGSCSGTSTGTASR